MINIILRTCLALEPAWGSWCESQTNYHGNRGVLRHWLPLYTQRTAPENKVKGNAGRSRA